MNAYSQFECFIRAVRDLVRLDRVQQLQRHGRDLAHVPVVVADRQARHLTNIQIILSLE